MRSTRSETVRARQQLDTVIAARNAPAIVLASAYVAYALLLERDGDRARAIETYSTHKLSAAICARDQARAALKRLGSS